MIITIIVMVILAGVIILSAVADGGIIDRAEMAMKENERAEAEELVMSGYVYKTTASTTTMAILDLDATADAIYENLTINGFQIVGASSGDTLYTGGDAINLNIQGKHGNYGGRVTEQGLESSLTIIDEESTNGNDSNNENDKFDWSKVGLTVDTNTEYIDENYWLSVVFLDNGKLILTFDGESRTEIDVSKMEGNLNFEGNGFEGLTEFTITQNGNDINVQYSAIEGSSNGTEICRKVAVDNKDVYSNQEVLKALGITNSEGTYKGTWTKIGEENGKIKLVSTTFVSSYTLGSDDPKAKQNLGNDASFVDLAIWSYNNMENTLNTIAKEATGISEARCINLNDIEAIVGLNKGNQTEYRYYYNTADSKVYSQYKTGTGADGNIIWSTGFNTGSSSQTFIDGSGKKVVIDSEGDEIILTNTWFEPQITEEQREKLGILKTNDYYHLASSYVRCLDNDVAYGNFDMDGWIDYTEAIWTTGQGSYGNSKGIRAIVYIYK